MNLKNHYNNLWNQSLEKFEKEQFEFDRLINSEEDTRYGLTLLARPSKQVSKNILQTLEEIRAVAPNQYYYPASDLHVTILSIISCYPGFSLDGIDSSNYRDIITSAIDNISPFRIRFQGLTASPSCILMQGFPENHQLDLLRGSLRNKFAQSNLQHSIDKRYQLQTAHMTTVRFKDPFADAEAFVNTVAGFRDTNFGSSTIDTLELVGNDWYQQKEKVKLLNTFTLITK